jgi:hypothetical protein
VLGDTAGCVESHANPASAEKPSDKGGAKAWLEKREPWHFFQDDF